MKNNAIERLECLEKLVDLVNDQEITAMSRFLYERISNPDSYLVFLGETSSGKSSIINGLIGRDVLPMKASPTTAAITEIELSDSDKEEWFAVNKDATMKRLDNTRFKQLAENPDQSLKRLKCTLRIGRPGLKNLRIFDTPGYGSIMAEHEEVLKDFLPNSDIVIYTVNYKIGVQEEDYVFLGFLKELIREDVPILLVINRCPDGVDTNDSKIEKIRKTVSDLLVTLEPKVFVIPNMTSENNDHPLPDCPELWDCVDTLLNSAERQESLYAAFDTYVYDLYSECFKVIENRYIASEISNDEYEKLLREQQASADRLRLAIDEYINPAFDQIISVIPTKLDAIKEQVKASVDNEIDEQSRLGKEEMVGYVNAHLMPHTIKVESKEIQNYINIMLGELNEKVDDYIQKEVINFRNNVTISIQSNMQAAMSGTLGNILTKIGTNSLQGYFIAFGGAGGANAGIANAASHLLKETGDLFGHTFSRATHNGLKQALAKIGATSMRAVGAAVAVVVELLSQVVDLATWKWSLKKKVRKGVDKWEEEASPSIIKDLNRLRDENIETIENIAKEVSSCFDGEKPQDIAQCRINYEYAKEIGVLIGAPIAN